MGADKLSEEGGRADTQGDVISSEVGMQYRLLSILRALKSTQDQHKTKLMPTAVMCGCICRW